MHFPSNASKAFGECMSVGIVRDLKKIQQKWSAFGSTRWLRSPFFCKSLGDAKPLTPKERKVVDSHCTRGDAIRLLQHLDPETPFSSRLEYLQCMKAVSDAYAGTGDLTRTIAKDWNVKALLVSAMKPEAIEYFANGARWRTRANIRREDVAPETTGNEGFHHDLKNWGSNVHVQTRERASLGLNYWVLHHLISHLGVRHFTLQRGAENRRHRYVECIMSKTRHPYVFEKTGDLPCRVIHGAASNTLKKASIKRRGTEPSSPAKTMLLVKKPAFKKPAARRMGESRFQNVSSKVRMKLAFANK